MFSWAQGVPVTRGAAQDLGRQGGRRGQLPARPTPRDGTPGTPGTPAAGKVRRGFALVDVLIAVMLLGILALGVIRVLSQQQGRTVEALERSTALALARGQVERIRAAGPLGYSTPGESFHVTSSGARDSSGVYVVHVRRVVTCQGGLFTEDMPASLLSWNCGNARPVVSYRVSVDYPSALARRITDQTSGDALGAGGTMGALGVEAAVSFGESDLTREGCRDGMSWDSEANGGAGACGCPGGQVVTAGVCQCPSGMAWSGNHCQSTTCAGPFTEYETRFDCGASQQGQSQWRRDVPPDYCLHSGGVPVPGPWIEVSRQCGCPGGQPSFVDGQCRCTVPPTETRTLHVPCGGDLVGDTVLTDTRSRDDATCSTASSPWTRLSVSNTCHCPIDRPERTGESCGCTLPAAEARTDTLPCPSGATGHVFVSMARTRASGCTGMSAWAETGRISQCTCASGQAPGSAGCTGVCTGAASETCPNGTSALRIRSCQADGTWSDWDESACACPTGQTQTSTCPDPYKGNRMRVCRNGAWDAWDMSTCKCPGGQVAQDGSCTCPNGLIWLQEHCVPKCSKPRETASCSGGRLGTTARSCQANGHWTNWDEGSCSCPASQIWTGSSCICASGAARQGQTCSCPANQVVLGSGASAACGCAPGSEWNGSTCVVPQCTGAATGACSGGRAGQVTRVCHWNGWGAWDEGGCWCPGGSLWNGSSCACPSGTTWGGSGCMSCPGNMVWVNGTGGANSGACACPAGTFWTGVTCTSCPAPMEWNATTKSCVAPYVPPLVELAATPSAQTVGQPVRFTATVVAGSSAVVRITVGASSGDSLVAESATPPVLVTVFRTPGPAVGWVEVTTADGRRTLVQQGLPILQPPPPPTWIRRLGEDPMWSGAAVGANGVYLEGAAVMAVTWYTHVYANGREGAWRQLDETPRYLPLTGSLFPCTGDGNSVMVLQAEGIMPDWTTTLPTSYVESYDGRRGCA